MLLPHDITKRALEKHDLTKEPFIPANFTPSTLLQVRFPASGKQVELGNEMTPSEASSQPLFFFVTPEMAEGNEQATYTVVCVDPDAPRRDDHRFGPWRHYVHQSFKPAQLDQLAQSSTSEMNAKDGPQITSSEEPLTPWLGPAPGPKSGTHRYVFLLYKEKQGRKVTQGTTIKSNEFADRRKFDVETFVGENDLELIGANFFLVPTDDL